MKSSTELTRVAKDIFYEEIPAVANMTGADPVLLYQGITLPHIQNMAKNGGNPLGVLTPDGPLYLIHVACWWQNEADNAAICQLLSTVLTRITAEAKARSVQNDYIYMDYASQ